jgi:large subunit ribosomal protein L30
MATKSKAAAQTKRLRITWIKSTIGYSQDQRGTVRALGLHRLHQSVMHDDTPVIRGMATKVRHLVQVEEVDE